MTKTVLLVLDVQNGIIERLNNTEAYLERLVPVIEAARRAAIQIVHVRTAFRPGYPDAHPNNVAVSRAKDLQTFIEGDESVEIHRAVTPKANEPIITKRRVSAFTATDLDLVLRCLQTERLVVAGLVTSGAVLSTVRQAADLDYNLTVLEDLCMDKDQEVHKILMEKVLSRQASVITSAKWLAELQ
ncbi:cysteine hydrolase family protein [Aspergillus clavatus NRRL 1]|uniref:Isochorismatase family protein n=1 Tax=Aspergillus clavatus (strain ATCC 1007 / CBS 513.65 / DSM 816 / NCTC 3887 / NRRL 1 / QM 1276 / 107) TaxID=344612 RepID=A1CSZ2_ASPCL|nr:isochorismatase family protein [Aspergillus clavatus NRRL 1]EAW06429.1 isochorismatase family protein [Aspergillus clavatus NRRL 1]